MNQFANIQNSQGLLKEFYENGDRSETPLSAALKKKRRKLKDTKIGASDGITSEFNDRNDLIESGV